MLTPPFFFFPGPEKFRAFAIIILTAFIGLAALFSMCALADWFYYPNASPSPELLIFSTLFLVV